MKRIFSLFLLVSTTFSALAATPDIQKIVSQHLSDAHVGVYVYDMKTGKTVVDYNAKQHFTPASTAKLFTAYAALKTLGPDFNFSTNLYLDPQRIQSGVYSGPVYLKFSGDPSLRTKNLQDFAYTIKKAGINEIHGDIIIDADTVPAPYHARGWAQEDLDWYYAAPVSAAIVDENKIVVQLMTSPTAHQPIAAKVTTGPALPITSHLVSANPQDARHLCQFNSSIDENNHITLYGCWPTGKGPISLKMAIANPVARAAQIFEKTLNAQGIRLTGSIKEGKTPAGSHLFAQKHSEPLSKLLTPVLQRSHNLYTETLVKQVGAHRFDRASFQAGSYAVERVCYESLGIPDKSIQLYDGSGLSNYSITTAQALGKVLEKAYVDETIRPIFMNSLSHSGQNGTLRGRLNSKQLVGRFIGKTGGMAHTYNLAGYFYRDPAQPPLVVVIMINQTAGGKNTIRIFENALMKQLLSMPQV